MLGTQLGRIARSAPCALVLAGLAFGAAAPATAQAPRYRLTINESESLSWWQVSPHLNHLWATTCPQEPNWQPGEDRGSGWKYDRSKMPKTGWAAVVDTIHVPVFPRLPGTVESLCPSAVRGEITAADTTGWKGVRGLVLIRSDAFITGLNMRDEYAKKAVLQAQAYPDVRYQIDSLTDVVAGDTLTANAVGVFELRGIKRPMSVPVRAWHEGGGLRVVAKFKIDAVDLIETYKISRFVLGLGVGTGIWKYLHLGVDVVLNNASRET